ncbi:MAG: hypothetical protein AB7E96_12085 [Deferribacterales bacterium]
MTSTDILALIQTVFNDCGLDGANVTDAHKTNILKKTPYATVSCGDDVLTQDVDLVGIVRTTDTETRYKQRYVRVIPVEVEITHKTNSDAEVLALLFLAALPSKTVVNDVWVKIKAEKVQRKVFAEDKLVGVKDAKSVVAIKITEPIISTETRTLIKTINLTYTVKEA